MGRQLGAVEMFEAAEQFKFLGVVVFGLFGVSETGVPLILIEKGNAFLDRGWEITITGH